MILLLRLYNTASGGINMGLAITVIGVLVIIYKIADEYSMDHCNAKDVDFLKLNRESYKHTAKEQKKLYKSGYYNKKK